LSKVDVNSDQLTAKRVELVDYGGLPDVLEKP